MSRFVDELQVTPLADGMSWRLNTDFRYESKLLGATVIVPARFVTDFTSSPREMWGLVPPWQKYGAAAVVHDYLYTQQEVDRETADDVLREAMHVLGVDEETIGRIWVAVRTFGSFAWARNAKLKASGYTRMAPMNSPVPPYAAAI